MKPCPFCAEEIQDTAIKCKHCGTMLSDGAAATKGTAVDGFWKGLSAIVLVFLAIGFAAAIMDSCGQC